MVPGVWFSSSAAGTGDDDEGQRAHDESAFPSLVEQGVAAPTMQDVPTSVYSITLKRRPVFPGIATVVPITDEAVAKKIRASYKDGHTLIGLFLEKDAKDEKDGKDKAKGPSEVYEVGLLARIKEISEERPGGNVPADIPEGAAMYVLVEGLRRIKRGSVEDTGKLAVEAVENGFYDTYADDQQTKLIKAHLLEMIHTIYAVASKNPSFHMRVQRLLMSMDHQDPFDLSDLTACLTTTGSATQLQEVLESTDPLDRVRKALLLIKNELIMSEVQMDIQMQLNEKISAAQRRMQLMEQLKTIKAELGLETDEKEALVDRFRKRLKGLKLPEDAAKVVDDEINKLQNLEPVSAEYTTTRNYLDCLTTLPWGVVTRENLEMAKATKVLDREHYGLKDVKDRILELIAVGKLKGKMDGKILLLVGPPGTGKTSIGKSIANALGRKFFRFSVGGVSDVSEIKGHRRTYVGAMPGKLLQALKSTAASNPVVLIDEIDKLGSGYQGDPASALLEALDPEQNSAFLDHYLDVPFDLSKVLFVCTANVLDTIPGPLLDRMEVLRLSGYVQDEKVKIVRKHLLPHAMKESGLKKVKAAVKVTDGAINSLISSYCREAGVRNLQKHVDKMLRKAAYKIASGEDGDIVIDKDNLHDFVGKPVFHSDRLYDTLPPGVVTGLAWTSMGGACLYIEAVADEMDSKPGVNVTGQLGDVMVESSSIAYTYSKSLLPKVEPENSFFQEATLHVHFPEGAVPKDGPSAGIALVTALISLATRRAVPSDLAMTGEVTLTGKVLAIGGVKEKCLGAKRSGIRHLIFPEANRKDYEELPEYIRKGLVAHFASHYHEVYNLAFGGQAHKQARSKPATRGKKATTAASAES